LTGARMGEDKVCYPPPDIGHVHVYGNKSPVSYHSIPRFAGLNPLNTRGAYLKSLNRFTRVLIFQMTLFY